MTLEEVINTLMIIVEQNGNKEEDFKDMKQAKIRLQNSTNNYSLDNISYNKDKNEINFDTNEF